MKYKQLIKIKAIDLVDKFRLIHHTINTPLPPEKIIQDIAKKSALIAVDEVSKNGLFPFGDKNFFEKLKQEIENL